MDSGTIVQINVSLGGIPKRAVASAIITAQGLAGDVCAHPQIHGGPQQAVLLIAAEAIDDLKARGYPVFYGALGENLTTRGLDRRQVRVGDQFRAGAAVLEITKVRGPCTALDVYGQGIKQEIYDAQVNAGDHASPRWGMSGFYARVIEPGAVHPDDPIRLLTALS
jgi:MOSC domain-containing protein YiiM